MRAQLFRTGGADISARLLRRALLALSAEGLSIMSHDAKRKAIIDFLSTSSAANPSLATHFEKFEDLYTRKLWHQLMLALEEFVSAEGAAPLLGALYETFVTDFKQKLNKLTLARVQVHRLPPRPPRRIRHMRMRAPVSASRPRIS